MISPFTLPPSLYCVVRVLADRLAPYKGRVYDPCCGSVDMLVQSEKFVVEHGGRGCLATTSRCYTGTFLSYGDEQDIVVERFNAAARLIAALRSQLIAARRVN